MALKPCSECGHQVSTKAVSCPSCGNPNETEQPGPKNPIYGRLRRGMGGPRPTPMTRLDILTLRERTARDALERDDLTKAERSKWRTELKQRRRELKRYRAEHPEDLGSRQKDADRRDGTRRAVEKKQSVDRPKYRHRPPGSPSSWP